MGIILKRGVGAKQPQIAAAVLAHDALRLSLAHGPGILERVARAEELFPAVRASNCDLRVRIKSGDGIRRGACCAYRPN